MIMKMGDQYIQTKDIVHAKFETTEGVLYAKVVLRNRHVVDAEGEAAEYLQTILNAHHAINVTKVRGRFPG